MVVGDLPVDTGVRDDFDDSINMIDEKKFTYTRGVVGTVR